MSILELYCIQYNFNTSFEHGENYFIQALIILQDASYSLVEHWKKVPALGEELNRNRVPPV